MKNKVSVYIIEDEFIYRDKIKKSLMDLPKRDLFDYTFVPVESPLAFYKSLEMSAIEDNDLFILDIDLKTYFTGIDIGQKIRSLNQNCFIVFLTNLSSKRIEVINAKVHAFSYLLKPLPHEEADSQWLIEDLFRSIETALLKRSADNDQFLVIPTQKTQLLIPYKKIIYISAAKHLRGKILIKTIDEEFLVNSSLKEIKKKLTPNFFYKGLRSYIFNLAMITSVDRLSETISFKDDSFLHVGTRIIDKLKKSLH